MLALSRRFIKDFAKIAAPLNGIQKGKRSKRNTLKGTCESDLSFIELKSPLVNFTMLATPDFSKQFKVYCDHTSSTAIIAGVLIQDDENGIEKPLAFVSR